MDNKLIIGVISVFVAIVVLSSALVPVVDQASETTTHPTFTNEGTALIKGDPTAEYVMNWDAALPGTIKVNGNVTTVYFAAGSDATVSPASKDVIEDLTYGTLPTPTRTGYTFDGWFTSTDYTTEITSDSVVVGKNDRTLYAKWLGNEYTLTFEADGGTVYPASKTVVFGSPYGELPTPEKTGHIFGGWFDSDNEPITAASIVDVADDQTVTAAWTTDSYLVSFTSAGNGTVDVQSLTVDYGTAYTISSNTIVIGETTITATAASGYVFDHWDPSSSGTISGATTFTAYFNNPPVTISFTAQSPGSVSAASVADVPIGTQYTVADNVVTITGFTPVTASLVDGYYFTGWNVAQGTGTVSGAMTFTAEYEIIEIAKVVCSTTTTWVVTTDGKLYGCGHNNHGQQGDGTTTNVTTFTQRLDTETIADVVCSTDTTWAVTTDGKLYGCGHNNHGQQSDGTTTDVTTFTQRLDTETIAKVVCSITTTWVVTTDGKLYGCGYNNRSQQGTGNNTNDVTAFTQRLDTETIADVSCSQMATWALTIDGKLYGCGRSTDGRQGSGGTANVTTFTQRLDTETIAKVVCSESDSYEGVTWAITTDGKLYGCGYNNSGQQGDGTTTNVTTFTQRLDTETIADVSCSSFTTWAITTDGKLFGCGSSYNNQQGNGTTTNVTTFTQRLDTETIAKVVCSGNTTWVVTTDGKLYGCGYNNSGQQGDGTTTNVTTFTQRLDTETIADVSCPSFTTWAITTDGKLFGCGHGGNGQQGNGTTTNVTTFTQRAPAGSINIAPVQQLNLSPLQLNPRSPIIQPLLLQSVTPADIIGTDYTFLAGGNDWMLCSVSVGADQYALALYYAGLDAPLLWDDDLQLTFSNGSLTAENNSESYTMTYTSIFFRGNGDYVILDGTGYINPDSPFLGYALPTTDSGAMIKGSFDSSSAVVIAGDIVISARAVGYDTTDYDDVLQLTGLDFLIDDVGRVNASTIIVPKTITSAETITTESEWKDLYGILPVMIIVAIVAGCVGWFILRKPE